MELRKRQRDNNNKIWGENKKGKKNENLCLIKNWLCDKKKKEGKMKC